MYYQRPYFHTWQQHDLNCHTHMNSLQPQKCQYEEDNVCATLPLLRLNLIDNLCRKAWPQPHFIDSFVMWMWYLAEERCLLLAPHAAIFSSHIFEICPSPFVCLQTHWSLGGDQRVHQSNYCQYRHVYVCIWTITVLCPLRSESEACD